MTADRLRVGVLFGGRSCEHEVSVRSARSVLRVIDRERFEPVPIGVTRAGRWRVLASDAVERIEAVDDACGTGVSMLPHPRSSGLLPVEGRESLERSADGAASIDVIFPLIHGPLGEDGSVQGLLELAGLPYVGAGVQGSAVGMDKPMMKALLAHAGLPVCRHRTVTRRQWREQPATVRRDCQAAFPYPWFVKPANLGSSVGVSRVNGPADLVDAMDEATRYDRRVVVEQAVEDAREVEVAVLGNDDPVASVPGEIVTDAEFYDYRAKYHDEATRLVIPAGLSAPCAARVRSLALEAFRTLDGAGLARVDFLVRRSDEAIFINEVNTLPGFTDSSMYPKLWDASGIGFRALVDRLIELALERHVERMENRVLGPTIA